MHVLSHRHRRQNIQQSHAMRFECSHSLHLRIDRFLNVVGCFSFFFYFYEIRISKTHSLTSIIFNARSIVIVCVRSQVHIQSIAQANVWLSLTPQCTNWSQLTNMCIQCILTFSLPTMLQHINLYNLNFECIFSPFDFQFIQYICEDYWKMDFFLFLVANFMNEREAVVGSSINHWVECMTRVLYCVSPWI